MVMMDSEGRIILWNPAAEHMFGYTAMEAIGHPLHGLLAPAAFHGGFQEHFPVFQATGRGPAVGKVVELSALRKDGTEFPMELALSSVQKRPKLAGGRRDSRHY